MISDADWSDLRDRLLRAVRELDCLVAMASLVDDRRRLAGKRQGVLLALDYMRSYDSRLHSEDSEAVR